jgi:hypothetical protein
MGNVVSLCTTRYVPVPADVSPSEPGGITVDAPKYQVLLLRGVLFALLHVEWCGPSKRLTYLNFVTEGNDNKHLVSRAC